MSSLGIDIGANACTVAVAGNKGVDIVVNDVSNRETPTVVGFGENKRCVGEAGLSEAGRAPHQTLSNLKLLLGRATDAEMRAATCKLIAATNGSVSMDVLFNGSQRSFCMEALLAMLIKHLSSQLKQWRPSAAEPRYVVLSVPGYFDMRQRQVLWDAAKIADVSVKRLVNEHTAVACCYGLTKKDLPKEKEEPRLVLFVDFGHNALTASLVAFVKGQLTVKSVAFDCTMGGRALTEIVTNHFVAAFKKQTGIDLSIANPKGFARLQRESEKVKQVLSANTTATLRLECLHGDHDLNCSFTREELDEVAAPMYARFTETLERALQQADVPKDVVHSVEAIGNSRSLPAFQSVLRKWFGKDISKTMSASEACARGCALMAAACSPGFAGAIKSYSVTDINMFDTYCIGAEAAMGLQCKLDRMAPLPASHTCRIAGPVADGIKLATFQTDGWTPDVSRLDERIAAYQTSGMSQHSGELDVRLTVDTEGVHVDTLIIASPDTDPEEPETEGAVVTEGPEPKPSSTKNGDEADELWHRLACIEPGLTMDQLQELQNAESVMSANDHLIDATLEKRNALEEYILRAKDNLERDWKVSQPACLCSIFTR
jgi:hypothetical protein